MSALTSKILPATNGAISSFSNFSTATDSINQESPASHGGVEPCASQIGGVSVLSRLHPAITGGAQLPESPASYGGVHGCSSQIGGVSVLSRLHPAIPGRALAIPEISKIGKLFGGIPRGAITEIAGASSSGRTSLMYALLAEATAESEFCALIDVDDAFDPLSAQAAGVRLSQILWVRCAGNVEPKRIEHGLKAADMLTQGGGFGLIAIDLADTPPQKSRRVPLAAWFRLRHAASATKTALLAIGSCFNTSTCSALKIELTREHIGRRRRLLESMEIRGRLTRNHQSREEMFVTKWH